MQQRPRAPESMDAPPSVFTEKYNMTAVAMRTSRDMMKAAIPFLAKGFFMYEYFFDPFSFEFKLFPCQFFSLRILTLLPAFLFAFFILRCWTSLFI